MAVILPSRLARDLSGQSSDGYEQFLPACSSDATTRARAEGHIYLLPGRIVVFPVSVADAHRHLVDVLLRSVN